MPNALFIEIRREPLDTGHSILKHRLQQTGSYQNWWSVPVPGMDALLKKSPEEQVLEQIWRTYRHIASMKEKFGQASFHVVKYGDLTKQPESTLQKIHQFFHQHGVDCKADFRYLPEARKKNRIVEIDQSMYRALQLKSRDYNLDDL